MKAKELRIGNWVRQPEGVVSHRYYPLDVFKWGLDDFSELENGGYSIDMIEPIPLTEEWLLGFGCVKDNNDFILTIKDEEYVISYFGSVNGSEKGFVIDQDFKCRRINCVHHFQNTIFDKTREELTIKEKVK